MEDVAFAEAGYSLDVETVAHLYPFGCGGDV